MRTVAVPAELARTYGKLTGLSPSSKRHGRTVPVPRLSKGQWRGPARKKHRSESRAVKQRRHRAQQEESRFYAAWAREQKFADRGALRRLGRGRKQRTTGGGGARSPVRNRRAAGGISPHERRHLPAPPMGETIGFGVVRLPRVTNKKHRSPAGAPRIPRMPGAELTAEQQAARYREERRRAEERGDERRRRRRRRDRREKKDRVRRHVSPTKLRKYLI